MIEVRYAGVVVGRSAIVRELDTRGLFLGITEPMPVGTEVTLRIGDRPGADEVPGKVELVSESQELARAGMRVRFADSGAAALFGTPSTAAPEPEPDLETEPEVTVPSVGRAPGVGQASVVSSAVGQTTAPDALESAAPGGPRRIVVDASLEKRPDGAAPTEPVSEEVDVSSANSPPGEQPLSAANPGDGGRITAPDPSAFGGPGGGGKKGRRNRRR